MLGHDRPNEGLRSVRRGGLDLERDCDSRQHATQYNDLEHGRSPWPFGPDEGQLVAECIANGLGTVRTLGIASTKVEG